MRCSGVKNIGLNELVNRVNSAPLALIRESLVLVNRGSQLDKSSIRKTVLRLLLSSTTLCFWGSLYTTHKFRLVSNDRCLRKGIG